jgi:tight adherence protein B
LLYLIVIVFLAVFSLAMAIYLGIVTAKESPKAYLKRRLRHMALEAKKDDLSDEIRKDILKETTPLDRLIYRLPFCYNFDVRLLQAGMKITPARFFLLAIALLLFGLLVGLAFRRGYAIAAVVSVLCFVAPFVYLEYKKRARLDKFTEQFPDTLAMISRSLRSGHSLTSALQLVGEEMADPIGEIFKTAHDQHAYGLRLSDTMTNMANSIDSLDLRFFITVVTINTEVGGNLAEVLDKLADTIRERLKIRRQVKVYTAQGRLSGYVLAMLPIATFFIFFIVLPGYEDVMIKEQRGRIVLIVAALFQVIGFFVIRKIIRIRI